MKRIKSFLAIVACSQAYGQQKAPDIIFILADDMGYGNVSYLDPRSKIRTDNLDRMARDGVVFTGRTWRLLWRNQVSLRRTDT